MRMSPTIRQLAREPFVHFVALGALIFLASHWLGGGASPRIELGVQDIAQLRAQSLQQWGQEPTAAQMDALIENRVREEVLVREALAQGLDRDDIVVRRRLAQKMEFLHHEGVEAPTQEQLLTWYKAHPERYTAPPVFDLEQVYFSTDTRGTAAPHEAQAAWLALQQGRTVAGDSFMLPRQLGRVDQAMLARDFGADFAKGVLQLTPLQWSAPLASAHGLHLVRVLKKSETQRLDFQQVQERVRTDWADANTTQQRDAAYAALRKKYTVVLPNGSTGNDVQLSALPGAAKAQP